ncbi:unnamed protein product [Caenorhabditis nigoni]
MVRLRTIYNATDNGSVGVLHLQHNTADLLNGSRYQYNTPCIEIDCSDACGCSFELFAMEPILKGQLLLEYTGEMMTLTPEKIHNIKNAYHHLPKPRLQNCQKILKDGI